MKGHELLADGGKNNTYNNDRIKTIVLESGGEGRGEFYLFGFNRRRRRYGIQPQQNRESGILLLTINLYVSFF